MNITISTQARRYIEAHGGEVYIYFDPVGRSDWMVQRVKLTRPPDRDLALTEHGGVRIWLDARFDPPPELEIRRAFWRFGPLHATAPGEGGSQGAYPGNGGSWPGHGHHGGGGDGGGHGGHGGHGGL